MILQLSFMIERLLFGVVGRRPPRPPEISAFTSLLYLPASTGVSEILGRSFLPAGSRPYCAAFSRSRMAPQERQTATPCLIFSAQTGHSATSLGSLSHGLSRPNR